MYLFLYFYFLPWQKKIVFCYCQVLYERDKFLKRDRKSSSSKKETYERINKYNIVLERTSESEREWVACWRPHENIKHIENERKNAYCVCVRIKKNEMKKTFIYPVRLLPNIPPYEHTSTDLMTRLRNTQSRFIHLTGKNLLLMPSHTHTQT